MEEDLATEGKENVCFGTELVSDDKYGGEEDLSIPHHHRKQEMELSTRKHGKRPVFNPTSHNGNLPIAILREDNLNDITPENLLTPVEVVTKE